MPKILLNRADLSVVTISNCRHLLRLYYYSQSSADAFVVFALFGGDLRVCAITSLSCQHFPSSHLQSDNRGWRTNTKSTTFLRIKFHSFGNS